MASPAPPIPTGPQGDTGIRGTATNGGFTANDRTVWAQIQQTLMSYGFTGIALQQLVAWAKNEIIAGNSTDQIALDLMRQPQFEQRFPAIQLLSQQGVAITPAEYISMEQSYAQAEKQAGITPNFASYDQLIANQVSPTEYSDRLTQGYLAVAMAPPSVQQEFQNYYGVGANGLAQLFLNPKQEEPKLLKMALAAQIGGAAIDAGFDQGNNRPLAGQAVSSSEAMQLAQQGVAYAQAQQGFQQLAKEQQLYQPLPGQKSPYGFTQTNLAQAQFGGDAQTALELQIRADYEKNTTNQGVGVTQTQQGQQGIGSVQR